MLKMKSGQNGLCDSRQKAPPVHEPRPFRTPRSGGPFVWEKIRILKNNFMLKCWDGLGHQTPITVSWNFVSFCGDLLGHSILYFHIQTTDLF